MSRTMSRRRVMPEPENHERWLVSYADFMTLLFALFVVMYAVSSVNEGKYRVLSDSLTAGFRGPSKTLEPIQAGSLARSQTVRALAPVQAPSSALSRLREGPISLPFGLSPQPIRKAGARRAKPKASEGGFETLAARVKEKLSELVESDQMDVRITDRGIELELKQRTVFQRGQANIPLTGNVVLAAIVDMLAPLPNPVHVEGHADSTPVNSPAYPSNWELSAARAASIVNYFMRQGLAPARLAAIGYGEHRPIADNNTAAGRLQNRRVVIVVHAAPPGSESRQP
jgi:chemotaxis protein MotB